jgi:hypothetical protein
MQSVPESPANGAESPPPPDVEAAARPTVRLIQRPTSV